MTIPNIRELKQTTMTTATRTSPNKRSNEQNNGCARARVSYKSLRISLPSSGEQQRKEIKFCVVYGTWTATDNFSYFHLEYPERRRCIFSLSTLLEPLSYGTDPDNREFRL